MLKGPDLWFVL